MSPTKTTKKSLAKSNPKARTAPGPRTLKSAADPDAESPLAPEAPPAAETSFADLGLPEPVIALLAKRGVNAPTPIQARVFAPAADGADILARSRTGSGKTLAFGLPLLQRLDGAVMAPQLLVLTPTRELAVQVARELDDVAAWYRLGITPVIGGASMRDQIRALKRSHIVVGTPGRLLDHLERGTLSLADARAIVLDEGDEMLDMGFLEDIQRILEQFPDEGQRLLFSATIPPAMRRVIDTYLREPVTVETERASAAHVDIRHVFYPVRNADRYGALANVLAFETVERVLIFTRTRQESQELALRLTEDGFPATFLNGDLSQDQRTHAMEAFRSGRTPILVATDVAARGIDVQGISHVVHFSLPGSMATYIHRSGRTGRAGASGVSLLFVSDADRYKANRLAHAGNLQVEWKVVPLVEQIQRARIARLTEELRSDGQAEAPEALRELAAELHAGTDGVEIMARLLQRVLAGQPKVYDVRAMKAEARPEAGRRESREGRFERGPRGRDEVPARKPGAHREPRKEAGMEKFRLPVGTRQRVTPGVIIQVLCRELGLQGSDFGRIDIQTNYTFVDVRAQAAGALLKKPKLSFSGKRIPIQPVR